MMKVEYERTARHSYMLVSQVAYACEDYELPMIINNKISGMLPLSLMDKGEETIYCYDITGLTPLEKLTNINCISRSLFRTIITSICNLKMVMEEYLLDDQNVLMEEEYIFYDRNRSRMLFCYIPGIGKDRDTNMTGLMESLLKKIDHSDQSGVGMAYQIYEKCADGEFVVDECLRIVNSDYNSDVFLEPLDHGFQKIEDEEQTDQMDKMNDNVYTDILDEYMKSSDFEETRAYTRKSIKFRLAQRKADRQALKKEKEAMKKASKKQKKIDKMRKNSPWGIHEDDYDFGRPSIPDIDRRAYNFSEGTTLLTGTVAENVSNYGETTCLSSEELKPGWYLHYVGDGLEHDIRLSHFPFVIGKGKDVDCVMMSATVSRCHARISCEEADQLILEDFNSTNGSYVNGKLVPMNTKVNIRAGDSIVFATEKFELKR